MSYVAVEGCELKPVSPATGTVTVDANQQSNDVFVNDKGVYFKEIKFHVAGSNGGGSVTNNDGTGTGTILASENDMLDEHGKCVMLEGDQVMNVQIDGHAGDESATGYITVKITKAGQTDVSLT